MSLPIYLMTNFPSVRPSLNLQFDSQPTPEDMTSHLASVGATFSRASIGTYTDANGIIQEATSGQARPNYSTAGVHEGLLIEESRTNFIRSSEDFSTSNWNATSGGSVTINQIIAPDGKASADLLTSKAGGSNFDRVEHSVSLTSGNDVTFSLFVKQYGSDDQVTIRLEGTSLGTAGTDTNSNYKFTFSTEQIDKISGGTAKSTLVEDYGNGWYRIGFTLDNATITRANIYPKFNSADASSVYIWGAQVEEGSFATSYIPTIPTFTSRASDGTYFDSSGVLQTTSGERIDHKYIDGQWVEAGLLLEGESTNLHLNSGDLTGNNSVANEVSLSLQTVTNPINGQTQVTRIADTAVSDAHYIQSSTITADGSSDYTFSILAKAGTLSTCRLLITGGGVGTVQMIVDLSDGSILSGSGTVEDVANGWYILSVTGTSTASSTLATRVYTTDGTNVTYTGSGEYIYVAYRQLEVGSQPTSYIATSGSEETRSADLYDTNTKERSDDVCYIDGTAFTDFYNQEEGTWFLNTSVAPSGSGGGILFPHNTSNPTGTRTVAFLKSASDSNIDFAFDGSYVGDVITTDEYDEDAFNKFAISIIENDVDVYSNGSSAYSASRSINKTLNKVFIGAWQDGVIPLTASMKKLIYFPRKLDNNELIKLTQ